MVAAVQGMAGWLRRNLAWSNSRQSWQERIAAAGLLAGALAILWYSSELSLARQVLLWGTLLLGLAALMRRGWLKLFGPVLFYDLVRIARRRRYIFLRCLYAIGLTFLLCWVYYIWTLGLPRNEPAKIRDMARLAETFFFSFMIVQSVLVVVLTPAYTAGAIAEEKDRKTLEFLLATDLRDREIVLSKLAARLANMTLILLTGLPILSLTQFFGGIDPDLLLAAFAGLGLTMLSLASVSIFTSVYAKKPRDAIVLTYLMTVAYIGLSGLSNMLRLIPGVARVGISLGSGSITIIDLVDWFNSGNLFTVLIQLGSSWGRTPLSDTLPNLLRNYAIFHGLVAVICSTWAVARLRGVALKQTYGKVKKPPLAVRLIGRPGIGGYPMLWKEIFAEGGVRLNWLGRIIVGLLVLGSFVPAVWIFVDFVLEATGLTTQSYRWYRRTPFEVFQQSMNIWVRIVGTIVACLTLLGVAVRASTTVSGERDRQTFDGLLTTPLSSHAILFAKWLGSILSVRWAWLWLGAIWAFAMITMGMTPLAVPLLLFAWFVYAAVFAAVGVWCSMACRTSLRATMWTIVSVIALSGGHWVLMSMCCYLPLSVSTMMRGRDIEWLLKLEAGQTPPVVLGWFALHGGEFTQSNGMYSREAGEWMGVCVVGVICWAVFALVLLGVTSARFQAMTGRTPFRKPDRPRPPPGRPRPLLRREAPLDVIPVFPDGAKQLRDGPQLRGAVEITDEHADERPAKRPV